MEGFKKSIGAVPREKGLFPKGFSKSLHKVNHCEHKKEHRAGCPVLKNSGCQMPMWSAASTIQVVRKAARLSLDWTIPPMNQSVTTPKTALM